MTTPILTVTVSEDELIAASRDAMKRVLDTVFRTAGGHFDGGGPGFKLLRDRVETWCETFDFAPLIEKLSAQVVEAALREAINKAVQARAGIVLSRMIAEGDLDARIAAIVDQKIAERGGS